MGARLLVGVLVLLTVPFATTRRRAMAMRSTAKVAREHIMNKIERGQKRVIDRSIRSQPTAGKTPTAASGQDPSRRRLSEYSLNSGQGEDWSGGQNLLDMDITASLAQFASGNGETVSSLMGGATTNTGGGAANEGGWSYRAPQMLDQLLTVPPANYSKCVCHGNPYLLWDSDYGDCFDPWHAVTVPSCDQMCNCHAAGAGDGGEDWASGSGSGSGSWADPAPSYEYSATTQLCMDVGAVAAANVSAYDRAALLAVGGSLQPCSTTSELAQCVDDPTYTDTDGDGCAFYAQSLDPLTACSFPGYEEALACCPLLSVYVPVH